MNVTGADDAASMALLLTTMHRLQAGTQATGPETTDWPAGWTPPPS